jgi:hypothetical protein
LRDIGALTAELREAEAQSPLLFHVEHVAPARWPRAWRRRQLRPGGDHRSPPMFHVEHVETQ